jgi:hypothetical protein
VIDEWPMNSLRALMLMFAAIISDAPCLASCSTIGSSPAFFHAARARLISG